MILRPDLAGTRVLVVEDEPLIAMHVEDVLVGLGCDVVGMASNTSQAMAILGVKSVDVAVLDINLGSNETSYPIADALAERSVPFVLLSGYSRTGQRAKDRDRPWLQKPVDESELSRALLDAIRGGTAPGA
jgi:CheY-like chemotaxis protein